ncbi:hypothetical protein BSZ35_06645 [Salinibacter sp. 10B]|nr:hypothetical protein BSZ35_06645 [Salinibacter sp. 10B]
MEAADVTLYPLDVCLVPWLHRLARRTDRIIRQNLWWMFGYNAVGLGLAVFGLLHPIAAVVIMTGSSLLVTGNSYRLNRKSGPDAESGPPSPAEGKNPLSHSSTETFHDDGSSEAARDESSRSPAAPA